jgi:UPF0755 protein
MKYKKIISYFIYTSLILLGLCVYFGYSIFLKPNVVKNDTLRELKIYPDENPLNLASKLDSFLFDTCSFNLAAKFLKLNQLKPGRYLIADNMSNLKIINKLKSGDQDPVKVTINSVRDIYQLAAKFESLLMHDSAAFAMYFTDTNIIHKTGYTIHNVLSLFIPNTYELYWSITPDRLLKRMSTEHDEFWNKKGRLSKAAAKGLSTKEIYTIASIVDKETTLESEKSIIAGVYLNRIKLGMKLQADPTVVYAIGQMGLKRVLLEHLKVDSPYNTYLNEGLPPGPICMPERSTIDSVLNANDHNYIFFCAKPGYEGGHVFAETMESHGQNARK